MSHTALDRWIRAGDLPVLYSLEGRTEIPIPALLELYDAVQPEQGQRYVLKPTLERHRQAARSLRIGDDLRRGDRSATHDRARARNLAYHRVGCAALATSDGRHVPFRWRADGRIPDHYADRWAEVLDRPIRDIRVILVATNPDADDLRQNAPFAGLLSEPERRRILEEGN